MHIVKITFCGLFLFSIPSFAQVTFQNVPINTLPSSPIESIKGDFNNDGSIDIAVCNFNSLANQQVTLLLNTGSGTFSGTNKRNFSSSINPSDIATGDFNKDGNLDVVTCSQTNNNFSILLGDGTGNLAGPTNFPVGLTPRGIAVGDFNNDSNPDVIVSNGGAPRQAYIYLGNGAGGFSAPTVLDFANIFDVTVGDFNGDLNLDFAISAGGTVQPWFGNGSGTTFNAGTVVSGFNLAQTIIAHDLDGDGDLDLSSGNAYTLNDGTGNFAARIGFSQTGEYMAVGDLNGDGKTDIIASDNNNNLANIRVFGGDGTGSFSLLAKFEANVYPRSIQLIDVNNDGKLDAIGMGTNGSTHSVDVLFGEGNGYFSNAITKYVTVTDPRDIVKADFNKDGLIDLAICHSAGNTVSVYLGLGNGKFAKTAANHATGTNPFQMIVLDYNKDNNLDLAIVNVSGSSSITLLTGNGTGGFTALSNIVIAANNSRITAGDFNNDSNPDLIATSGDNSSFFFIAGTGSGFNSPITIPVSETTLEVRSADFNKDGNLDVGIVYTSNFPNRVVIFYGNGNGTFTEGSQYITVSGRFEIQDLNNDGNPDINAYDISVGSNDDFYINDGTGVFTGSNFTAGFAGTVKGFEDMDGDGFKDLILSSQFVISSEAGIIRILKGSASGPTTTQLINKTISGGHKVIVHDLNNDGKNDLISVSFNINEDYFAALINNTVAVGCPVITSQPASTNICEGQNVTLSVTASGNTPLSYQWRKGTNNIAGATSPGLTLAGVTLADAASYSCVISNGCGSVTSSTATLTINAIPNAPVAPPPVTRCGTGSVTLSTSGGTNGQYRWYTQAAGGTALSGAVNDTYTTGVLTTPVTYYVALSNGSCESNRTAIPVTINLLPAIPIIVSSVTPVGNSITVCSSATLTFNAPAGFAAYLWSNGSTLQQISITTSAAYSVIVTDAAGCTSPASDVITVTIIPAPCNNQAPVINTTTSSTVIEGQATINLLDLISDADNNLVPSSLAVAQQPTSGASATITNGVLEIDYKGLNFSGRDQVTIRVCDVFGECTQQVLEIDVIGDIEVYNGISPNGDELNDIFLIQYIDVLPDTQNNKVTIFNRWGSKVFEVSNYNNTTNVFRGLNDNGNELPSGTYFYKIEFAGGRESMTGYLSLKR